MLGFWMQVLNLVVAVGKAFANVFLPIAVISANWKRSLVNRRNWKQLFIIWWLKVPDPQWSVTAIGICQVQRWQGCFQKQLIQRSNCQFNGQCDPWGTWFARHGAILEEFVDPLQSRFLELSYHGMKTMIWAGTNGSILLMGQKSGEKTSWGW